MRHLLPNKKTSKNALYFLTVITLTIALVGWITAEAHVIPDSPEITLQGQPDANYDPSIASLPYVTYDIEGMIRQIADEMDFQWPDYLVRLATCESNLNPDATHDNGTSVDRGLFQINNYFHSEVSDEQAFDPNYATRWTINMINNGQQHQWTCDRLVRK